MDALFQLLILLLSIVQALAPKSQCHPNPCQNAGTCRENGPGYDCICTTGYKGPHCESKCEHA